MWISIAGRFIRLWLVLFISYFCAKLAWNLLALGWIDLRPVALGETLVVPLAQALFISIVRGFAPVAHLAPSETA